MVQLPNPGPNTAVIVLTVGLALSAVVALGTNWKQICQELV